MTTGKKVLEEIMSGIDDVTPGPWVFDGESVSDYGREWQGFLSMEWVLNEFDEDDGTNEKHKKDGAHIARCSPDRIRAIATYVAALEARYDERLTAEYRRSNEKCDTLAKDYEAIIDRKDAEIAELNKANVAYVDANTALIARAIAAEERVKRLEGAIEWALGEGDSDFGDKKPDNAPAFWWRTELRKRAALSGDKP